MSNLILLQRLVKAQSVKITQLEAAMQFFKALAERCASRTQLIRFANHGRGAAND
jgi:hypothetical protein